MSVGLKVQQSFFFSFFTFLLFSLKVFFNQISHSIMLAFSLNFSFFPQKYQGLLDKSVPYLKGRWIGTVLLLLLYVLRVVLLQVGDLQGT